MRFFTRGAFAIPIVLLMALSLAAQTRRGDDSNNAPRGAMGSSRSASGGGAPSGFSGSGTGSTSVNSSAPGVNASAPTSGYYQPSSLQGTSFSSTTAYYNSYIYYSYLSAQYHVDPFYFARFYRHSEPLITPLMLKLTLGEPIMLSSQMLVAIDQFESLLGEVRSGKTVDRKLLEAKSHQIQKLAKRIRQNQTISYMDLRKGKDVYEKVDGSAALGPETFSKLREMAASINRQLNDMYRQSSTSTVSVNHLNQPSLESLAKGIERLSKAIESSSKRM